MIGKNPKFWKEKNGDKIKVVFSIPVIWIEIIEENSSEPIPYLCKVFLSKLIQGKVNLPTINEEYLPTETTMSNYLNRKVSFISSIAGRKPVYWIKGVPTRNREFFIPLYWNEKLTKKYDLKVNMLCIIYIYSLIIKFSLYQSEHPFDLLDLNKSKYLEID